MQAWEEGCGEGVREVRGREEVEDLIPRLWRHGSYRTRGNTLAEELVVQLQEGKIGIRGKEMRRRKEEEEGRGGEEEEEGRVEITGGESRGNKGELGPLERVMIGECVDTL